MGNTCTKQPAGGRRSSGRSSGGGRSPARSKGVRSEREMEQDFTSGVRLIERVQKDMVDHKGKLVTNVYGQPREGHPEIDPADGEPNGWYTRDHYCDSYAHLYKQHYMLIGDVENFSELFDKLDEGISKLQSLGKGHPGATDALKKGVETRAKLGAMVKSHLMAWGNSVRLVDEIEKRDGTLEPLKSKGYSIRRNCFIPFLTKYFPDEFTKAELTALWTEVEKEVKKEGKRMGAIQSLPADAKAKLYAEISANSKGLMAKYEKWLKQNKATPVPNADKTDVSKVAGKYVKIVSSIVCSAGFVKDDTDTALSNGGETFGHHWGFFENGPATGTWAITWTDEISKAYNTIEKIVNPSGYDHQAMFQMSPADTVGKVASAPFEINVPRYELFNPLNKEHKNSRNRNHTYQSNEGEMVKIMEKKGVPHIQAEAVCTRPDGPCLFLMFPGGNCLDGIDLTKYTA